MQRVVKLIVVVVILFAIWKFGVPWFKEHFTTGSSSSSSTEGASGDNTCVSEAQRASEAWGSGIGRFGNPPVDQSAWAEFKDGVESKISAAESHCDCSDESCEKVRSAMRELRGVVSDFDAAVHNNSGPPGDVVQRQESIDNQLDQAAELVRAGK